MIKKVCIGIDPGSASGVVTVIYITNNERVRVQIESIGKDDMTSKGISDLFKRVKETANGAPIVCVLEKIWVMPGQGIVSAASFLENYGLIKGILITLEIAFELITPQKWQPAFVPKVTGRKVLNKKEKEGLTNDQIVAKKKAFKSHNDKLKREHKQRLYDKAEQILPDIKILKKQADSVLLAVYAKKYIN